MERIDPRQVSQQDLMSLGVNDVAYVKRVTVQGATRYAAQSAEGQTLFLAPSEQVAVAGILRHDLTPVALH